MKRRGPLSRHGPQAESRVSRRDLPRHVMNRGDRREPIFRDHADRQRSVETLAEVCANRLAGPCLLPPAESFSSGGRDAPAQPGGRHEVVSGHLPPPLAVRRGRGRAHLTFFRSADILFGLGLTNAPKPTRRSALLSPKLP